MPRQLKATSELTPDEIKARRDYFSWKDLVKTPAGYSDPAVAEKLWKGALDLLSQDEKDWQQKLPQDLVDEDHTFGYGHIKYLLEMLPKKVDHAGLVRVARPFLMVITHPALLDCLSVDMYVGDLYHFISGSGGTRAIPFLQGLCEGMLNEQLGQDILVTGTMALREVLRRCPKALLHEDLPALVESMQNVSSHLDKDAVDLRTVQTQLTEVHRVMRRAQGILVHDSLEATEPEPLLTSTYPRNVTFPRNSHDNDKLDMIEIKILPTEDEIRSKAPEFLPSPHVGQLHYLEGVERLFDLHFRLLRHDSFGVLKEVLGPLLDVDSSAAELERSLKGSLDNNQAYVYQSASVKFLKYTKKSGLEAQISFLLPRHLRHMQPREKQRWWEDSRRLEEGSLLCLLSYDDNKKSLIFLTVGEKITNHQERRGLSSGGAIATITSRLAAEQDQVQVESLIRLATVQRNKNVLIEFPGILLASFVPILENLQHMQKVSRLPFEQWILPYSTTECPLQDLPPTVPPPSYARERGFRFDLGPILKNPHEATLTLKPGLVDRDMQRKLETFTQLDEGQCEALIQALNQEFVLIQGPPGTGKSFVGVQIMRVLIANKDVGRLGPIVVV